MSRTAYLVQAGVATVLIASATLQAAPPEVRAVSQRRNHCGVASAETILRAYGETADWIRQDKLAIAHCVRIPDFRARNPGSDDIQERYYPDYPETYQSILAEMLIDRGYCVISTRASIDAETKRPSRKVWDMLLGYLQRGRMAIIHVPGHYMAAVGVDERRKEMLYVDPSRPGTTFRVTFDRFTSGESFHAKLDGSPRPGWDGRALILWKGALINECDACPNCRRKTAGKRYRFCRRCQCFIDRRPRNHVQLTLDAVAACSRLDDVTELEEVEVRSAVARLLKVNHFSEADVLAALRQYPLRSNQRDSLLTLGRLAESTKVDISRLSIADTVAVLSAKQLWQEVLNERLSRVGRRPAGSSFQGGPRDVELGE